ncbi:hypothetical protein RND81_04G063200 [Saponaria officinalis]|uniref:GRF-type domain-containing protein n=1 Tax=Saponaria officinalis TaxID=3572 RepID=A0AAW1LJF5_SAPOF
MKRSSSSSSNSFGSKNTKVVFCNHSLAAVLRTVKKGPNVGKKFYGCSLWPVVKQNGCGFFQLEETQVDVGSNSTNSDLKTQIKNYEAKLKKLKLKNEKLKMEVSMLKVNVTSRVNNTAIIIII